VLKAGLKKAKDRSGSEWAKDDHWYTPTIAMPCSSDYNGEVSM